MEGSIRIEARTLSDALKAAARDEEVEFVSGGMACGALPRKFVVVRKIPELRKADKWDRSYSFGSSLTLSEIEDKGGGNLPALLHEAILSVGDRATRNVATIGGNVMADAGGVRSTLYAPLLALGSSLEFQRNKGLRTESKTVQMSRLQKFDARGWLLTKIRTPNEEWGISIFRRIGPDGRISEDSASFAFLADAQDGKISRAAMAFAGKIVVRSLEFESRLSGLRLPLSASDIREKVLHAKKILEEEERCGTRVPDFQKIQFLNLVRLSLEHLA